LLFPKKIFKFGLHQKKRADPIKLGGKWDEIPSLREYESILLKDDGRKTAYLTIVSLFTLWSQARNK